MTLSAEFSVNGSSAVQEHTVAYAGAVALIVLDGSWKQIEWSIISGSKSGATAPTITPAGSPTGATASFTQVANPGDGLGRAWIVKCLVRDGQGGTAVAYRIVGTANVNGRVPLCADELNYRDATHGWSQVVNAMLADVTNATLVNVMDYGAVGDGSTNNNTALQAAVSAAFSAGSLLYWPAGDYLTTASITDLHNVRHQGPGRVKRGSAFFAVDPNDDAANTLFVAASGGSATNDGLGASQAISTLQVAVNNCKKYGPFLRGSWGVTVAAGTHTNQATEIEGLHTKSWFEISGPDVSFGTPTAIFDGSGSTAEAGIFISDGSKIKLSNVTVQDWTATDAFGVTALNGCHLWCLNVHASNCDFAGINAEADCRLYVEGGTINCVGAIGIRAAFQCHVSIGYNSEAVTLDGCETNIQIRSQSSGTIIGCTIENATAYGVQLLHHSECRFSDNTIEGNNVGVALHMSDWLDDSNTFATNTIDVQTQMHTGELDDRHEYSFDYSNKRHAWGNAVFTPQAKFHFQAADVATAFNGAAAWVLEDATPFVSFSSDGSGAAGLYFAKSGASAQGQLAYVFTDDSMRLRVANGDVYRWYSTDFRPVTDNVVDSGLAANRFNDGFITQLRPGAGTVIWTSGAGTPEGAVTAPVGSLFTRTDGGAATTLYVKESGAGNTGWVAK